MNNSHLSETVLDLQNQIVDLAEYELDETSLDSINGGSDSDQVAEEAEENGRAVADAVLTPFKAVGSFVGGFFDEIING